MSPGVKSILLAGVGGQGVIRASDIISKALMASGLDVKKSEVHGMAQRGGCVTSHVRYGRKVYSPISSIGSFDILLSFEKMEALRYLNQLRPDAAVIINNEEIYPPSVNLGTQDYPEDVEETFKKYYRRVLLIDGPSLAAKAGNRKAVNSVMIGALSRYMDEVDLTIWEKVIREDFPEKLSKVNLEAFHLGRISG